MHVTQKKGINSNNSKVDFTSNSRNELVPILGNDATKTVDASLLHHFLNSKTNFRDWISRRIKDYQFVEGIDFRSNLSESSGGRKSLKYFISLDMAKELAMLERNERGRQARRYFIEAEKTLRQVELRMMAGMKLLPEEPTLFKGLKPYKVNGLTLWQYKEILHRIGYSHRSGSVSLRRKRYPQHFVNVGDRVFITNEYALHLYHTRRVYVNRAALQAAQPVLPLNFNQNVQEVNHA